MKTAAIGVVIKENEILLVHRRFYPQLWAPPGGFLDPGETPEETVKREIWEETGVHCQVFSKVYEFDFNDSHILVYACKYLSGDLQLSYESLDVNWFDINQLPSPLSPEATVFIDALRIINSI